VTQSLLSHRLLELQKQNLIKAAELNRSGLEAMIETHKTEINMLSLNSSILDLLNEYSLDDIELVNTVNQILKDCEKDNPCCEALTLYNKDRIAIASSDMDNVDDDGHMNLTLSFLYATKKPAVAVSGILDNSIEIGYPIPDADKNNPPIGYILSTLHLSYFDNYLDALTFGDTGYAVLLDHNGKILYHPDESLIGTEISSTKLRNIVGDFNKGQIQLNGSFDLYYNGTNQIYGYSVIPELDWVLLVKQDISEIWSMTSLILTLLIFICAIVLVVIIIFSHYLSKKYTEPIIELRDAMRKASDGDLTVQSNIRSRNELGELSKNFNKMLHIIRTNYEDLESMHEELLANEEQLRNNYDHIEYLAYHDTLTNLPNKLAFLDYVNAALITSPGSNKSHAVYFVDLDNFKTVNDTLGHEYGDSLLIHTAKILTTLGENGMLARAGGDEFLIFRENIESKEKAIEYAATIIDRFKDPIELNGEYIYLSMSIGIAIYPDNGLSPNALIKNADIAMYKSKDTGKNKYTLFDSTMEEELNRNTSIVDILRGAIENKDIYIQYQPQYELSTNSIIGFEALMRIRSDNLGFISPDEFIPVAEESGLIIELSAWLIREACIFNKKLIDHGITPRFVAVNISSVQINRPGFIDSLSDILNETGLPPEYLMLEITESTLVSSIMDATELLSNLQKLGVKISLDDFGTGYSSLNYLTKMPINTLKIDKSFINNICTSKKDARIAETIIALAHSLEIKVVAEGVETAEQLDLLKERKCDIIQGFIYSHPLHPEELEDLIRHK
jgi:diguanylate cyclase (GGDEF)-like protein